MGTYLKTKYPGIFKYVGRNGESYGIDYYAGGKKHREIVGPLSNRGPGKTGRAQEERQGWGIYVPGRQKKVYL